MTPSPHSWSFTPESNGYIGIDLSFWETDVDLTYIRDFALSQASSPEALLTTCLTIFHAVCSPKVLGESLASPKGTPPGLFVQCTGPSGVGKSSLLSDADHLLGWEKLTDPANGPAHLILPSTGQGLTGSFLGADEEDEDDVMGNGPSDRLVQVRDRGFAVTTEGKVLLSMVKGKADSVLDTALCKGYMSETMGETNADTKLNRYLAGGGYSLSAFFGSQYRVAHEILEMGSEIGLAQRLLTSLAVPPAWLENEDPEAPQEATRLYARLRTVSQRAQGRIGAPEGFLRALAHERKRRKLGLEGDDPLEAHKPVTVHKLALGFALLLGHDEITEEDAARAWAWWDLNVLSRKYVSERCRKEEAVREEARDRANLRRMSAVRHLKFEGKSTSDMDRNELLERTIRALCSKVSKESPASVSLRDLQRSLSTSLRQTLAKKKITPAKIVLEAAWQAVDTQQLAWSVEGESLVC